MKMKMNIILEISMMLIGVVGIIQKNNYVLRINI